MKRIELHQNDISIWQGDKSVYSHAPDIKKKKIYDEFPEAIDGAVYQIEQVLDWEKRIAEYSDFKKALYQKAFAK